MKDLEPIDWTEQGHYISEEAIQLGGCDSAVLGITDEGVLCYSYELLIDVFVTRDGMQPDEALEWVEFNIMGLHGNGAFHVVYTDILSVLFEIKYKHASMPEGYVGKCMKHAHTKEQALKYFAPKKPDKQGWTHTKRKLPVQIISVNEIPNTDEGT